MAHTPSTTPADIAAAIKARLRSAGINGTTAAEALGLHRTSLSRRLNDRHPLTLAELNILANLLTEATGETVTIADLTRVEAAA